MVNLILLISFVLDPLVWVRSAKGKFNQKKRLVYLFVVVDFIISVLSQYTNIVDVIGQTIQSIFAFGHIIFFMYVSFDGKAKKKIVHIGTMFMLYLVSELVAILLLSLLIPTEEISGYGIWNAGGSLMAKVVMLALVEVSRKKRFSIKSDMVPMVFLLILVEIPLGVLFRESKGSIVSVIMLSVIQIISAVTAVYIRRLLFVKNSEIACMQEQTTTAEGKILELEQIIEGLKQATKIESMVEKENDSSDASCIQVLEFFENRKKITVSIENIMYIERVGRKIQIVEQNAKHSVNSSILKIQSSLNENFEKINQGTIVNLKYVTSCTAECVILSGGISLYPSRSFTRAYQKGSETLWQQQYQKRSLN